LCKSLNQNETKRESKPNLFGGLLLGLPRPAENTVVDLTGLSAIAGNQDVREGGLLIVLAVYLVGSGTDSSCIVSDVFGTGITHLRPGSEIQE